MNSAGRQSQGYLQTLASVALAGTGQQAQLSFSPASLAWGTQQTGTAYTSSAVTLTNSGNTAANGLALSVPTGWTLSGSTCSTSLAAAASCSFQVVWSPTVAQAYSGSLTATTTTGVANNSVALTGTASAPSGSLTSNLALGSVQTGQTATATATLTNNGVGALSVNTAASTVTGTDFSSTSTTCGSSLAVGASCTWTVTFAPTAAAARSGALNISTGAGVKTSALTGTGVAPSLSKISVDNFSFNTPISTGSGHFIGVQNNGVGPVTINNLTFVASAGNFNAWMASSGSGNPNGGYCWPGAVLQPGWSCGAWANADTGSGTASFNTSAGTYTYTGSFTAKALSYSATTGASAAITSGQTGTLYTLTISNATPFTYYFPRFGAGAGLASLGRFTGGNAGNFVIAATTCGASIAPNGSCTVGIAASGISAYGTTYASSFQPNGTFQQTSDGTNATWAGVPNWLVTMGTALADVYVSSTNAVNVTTLTGPNITALPNTVSGSSSYLSAASGAVSFTNNGQTATTLSFTPPSGVTASPSSVNCPASAPCSSVVTLSTSATAASGTYSGALGVSSSAGGGVQTVNVSLTVQPPTPPSLVFGTCVVNSPTVYPAAATATCPLNNNGDTAATSITYSNPAFGTMPTVGAGSPSSCAARSACGNVVLSIGSGSFNGPIMAQPNSGSGNTIGVALTVNPSPAALVLSGCTLNSPTVAPTAASYVCNITNQGQTSTNVTYSSPAGTTASGPTTLGATGSGVVTVSVINAASAGSYSGVFTANALSSGTSVTSQSFALVVNPSLPQITSNPNAISASAAYLSVASGSVSFTNNGQTATTLTFSPPAGTTVSPTSVTCPASSACSSTVTVSTSASAAPGTYGPTMGVSSSAGGTATAVGVSLVVNAPTPAALTIGTCVVSTPLGAPATATCALSNSGQTAISNIGYSISPFYSGQATPTITGPTSCGAATSCPSSLVVSISYGTLLGTLTATPNAGQPTSTTVSLTYNTPTPSNVTASTNSVSVSSTYPASATSTLSFSNSGQTATTLTVGAPAGISLSTTTINCPAAVSTPVACSGSVTLTASNIGSYAGSLSFSSSAGGTPPAVSVSMTVSGSVATLANGAGLAFGTVGLNTATPQQAWSFRNDGNAAMSLSIGSLNSPFALVSNTCTSVGSGGTCSIAAQMATTAVVNASQTGIALTGASSGNRTDLSLTGSVANLSGTLVASPTSVSASGSGGILGPNPQVTFTNNGPGPVSGISIALVKNSGTVGDFFVSTDTCTGTTLASGSSCTVNVQFTSGCPTAGTSLWTLTISGTGAVAPVSVPVTGRTNAGICR